jgi:hypothetical protein
MFTADTRFRAREEEVAAKVIDGEAIIINLANGTYYSMDKGGAFVWELLQQQRSVGEIVDALAARYEVSREDAGGDLQRLMAELLKERLIDPAGEERVSGSAAPSFERRLPYEPPSLNVYRDMGDLLALDPPTPGLDSPWKDPEPSEA